MEQTTYIRVAVPVPLRHLFDYRLPTPQPQLQPGAWVVVPFGNRKLPACVIETQIQPQYDTDKIKDIQHVLHEKSLWSASLFELLLFAANYYHYALGEVLFLAAPHPVRQKRPVTYQRYHSYSLTPTGQELNLTNLKRAPQQQKLVELLQQGPLTDTQIKQENIPTTSLKSLLQKHIVQVETLEERSQSWSLKIGSQPLTLNTEQALAVSAITQSMQAQSMQVQATETGSSHSIPKVTLLNGVTGSGKTEVYLQAMVPALEQGKQVLVMVPEIGLTPQTIRRFSQRFQVPIYVYHSYLTDTERTQTWMAARDGSAAIVIGTRSSILLPFQNLGLMIVDEEHDLSFKQQDSFRYNARDLAVKRAYLESCALVLGSATPSLETLHHALIGRYLHVQLTQKAATSLRTKHAIIDLKQQRYKHGLSDQLITTIKQHVDAGNQVLLFLNRRGYASTLMCHECGWGAQCQHCQAHMTVHQHDRMLRCHHCGSQHPIIRQCGDCGSTHLITAGLGTEQVEQAIQRLFPDVPTLRIDRDSTRKKGQLEDALEAAHANQYPLLIGTQMLAKGHHFPNLTLVALLDVDSALYSSDFRASERLAQLYLQVAGRSGRAQKAGIVALQTHLPDHPLIQELVNNGYMSYATMALQEREQAMLPPFAAMTLLRADSLHEQEAEQALQQFVQLIEQHTDLTCIGPMPAPLAKKANRYRYQLLLHAGNKQQMQKSLHQLTPFFAKTKTPHQVRWSLDVDPLDFT